METKIIIRVASLAKVASRVVASKVQDSEKQDSTGSVDRRAAKP